MTRRPKTMEKKTLAPRFGMYPYSDAETGQEGLTWVQPLKPGTKVGIGVDAGDDIIK